MMRTAVLRCEHPIRFALVTPRGAVDPEPPRSPDEEITIEAPVPEIPDDLPSPLGDEPDAPKTGRTDPKLPPASCIWVATRPYPARTHDVVALRPHVLPEEVRAVREAREAVRREQAKTRRIVLAIWGAAVLLAGVLGVFALVS